MEKLLMFDAEYLNLNPHHTSKKPGEMTHAYSPIGG